MATVITVHGTNATGPEQGHLWWQRGSEFERDVRDFVQADDGKIDFKPFIWDGMNSEMSRRRAGTRLLREIQSLDAQGNEYCLLGHSHGGSVISHTLVESASRGKELKHLSRWITIATPFIQTRRNRLLFLRMGLIGKAAYLAALSLPLSFFWWFGNINWVFISPSGPVNVVSIAFIILILLPLLILYGAVGLFLRGQARRYAPSTLRNVAKSVGAGHLALYHRNDEAVEGLRAMGRLHLPIFGKRFAVNQMLLITAAMVPISLLTWAWNPWTRAYLLAVWSPITWLLQQATPALGELYEEYGITFYYVYVFAGGALTLVGLYLLALSILAFATPISLLASSLLSRWLDRLTWGQIRQSAFGNDTTGETAIGSLEIPTWSGRSFAPLPEDISSLLAETANEAAAQSIAKFRDAISKLAFSLSDENRQEVVAEYITWNELIHNVYFKSVSFRKLVCYAIAQSPGFSPSEKLKNVPEYEKLGQWLTAVQLHTSSPRPGSVGFPR
jgi:hypothetical protein